LIYSQQSNEVTLRTRTIISIATTDRVWRRFYQHCCTCGGWPSRNSL